MKNVCVFLFLAVGFLSFRIVKPGDDKLTKHIIIQFENPAAEKRMPEIITGLKELHGIFYLSHCDQQRLIVIGFDLNRTGGIELEKAVRSKVPVDLSFDVKEGTVGQVITQFSDCLIQEKI